MAGRYFDRLIARARGETVAIRTPPAPPVALEDPFDAPPVAAEPVYPAQPRTPARLAPLEAVTRVARVETAATPPAVEHTVAVPLPDAPREVVRHHELERERLVERLIVPPSPIGERREPHRPAAPVAPQAAPLSYPPSAREEPPAGAVPAAPPERIHTIERVVHRAAAAPAPMREPLRPRERVAPLPAPSGASAVAIVPVAPPVDAVAAPPSGPRLSIGQVIVEVVPRAPDRVAAASEPARVVVTRSTPAPRAGLFQRSFGLGQS